MEAIYFIHFKEKFLSDIELVIFSRKMGGAQEIEMRRKKKGKTDMALKEC